MSPEVSPGLFIGCLKCFLTQCVFLTVGLLCLSSICLCSIFYRTFDETLHLIAYSSIHICGPSYLGHLLPVPSSWYKVAFRLFPILYQFSFPLLKSKTKACSVVIDPYSHAKKDYKDVSNAANIMNSSYVLWLKLISFSRHCSVDVVRASVHWPAVFWEIRCLPSHHSECSHQWWLLTQSPQEARHPVSTFLLNQDPDLGQMQKHLKVFDVSLV